MKLRIKPESSIKLKIAGLNIEAFYDTYPPDPGAGFPYPEIIVNSLSCNEITLVPIQQHLLINCFFNEILKAVKQKALLRREEMEEENAY